MISVFTSALREPSAKPQMLIASDRGQMVTVRGYRHGIDGPEQQCKSTNGSEESTRLRILRSSHGTAIDGQLVDDHEVSKATHGVVAPLVGGVIGQGGKETSQHHDHIGHEGDQDVPTGQPGEESEIQQQKWGG